MIKIVKHNTTLVNPNLHQWFLIIFLVFAVLHFAFRYILQVNDSGTSYQYSDTPAYLSVIKDIAFLIYTLASSFTMVLSGKFAMRIRHTNKLIFYLCLVGLAYSIVSTTIKIISGQELVKALTDWRTVWIPLSVCMLVYLYEIRNIDLIFKYLTIVSYPILLFWAYTVTMYITEKRLPGLSYEGFVRFGGILDDPNGYGVLCTLFCLLMAYYKKYILAVLFFVNIIFTLSFSSYICIFTSLVCLIIINYNKINKWILFTSLFFLMMAGILYFNNLVSYYEFLIEHKNGSVEARQVANTSSFAEINSRNLSALTLGSEGFSENQYLLMLQKYGLIGLILITSLAFILIIRNLRGKNATSRIIGCWGVGLMVASIGVPYLWVYPISIIFWSLLTIGTTEDSNNVPPISNVSRTM